MLIFKERMIVMASTITFEKLITEAKTYLHEEKNIQFLKIIQITNTEVQVQIIEKTIAIVDFRCGFIL